MIISQSNHVDTILITIFVTIINIVLYELPKNLRTWQQMILKNAALPAS